MAKQKDIVYGFHAVQAVLQRVPEQVCELYYQEEKSNQRLEHLLRLASDHKIPVQARNKQQLDQLVIEGNHQGIIAICNINKPAQITDLAELLEMLGDKPAFFLVLDGVTDPHNLGACLRSANAAGVDAVIVPKDRAVGLTPVVRKVASGAAESTPFIQVTNLARTLKLLQEKGVWVYGASEDGSKDLYGIDFTGSVALVLGAEGSGLRRLTREHCDELMRIPTCGEISSLNVSVATGICLFEVVRQRLQNARKA